MNKEKRTIAIIGAGQMGRTAAQLLDPNRIGLLAFGDNDPAAQDSSESPCILSVEEALALDPDAVLISVMGEVRCEKSG